MAYGQQGTKLEFLLFENSKAIHATERNSLKSHCEQQTQFFTILKLVNQFRLQDVLYIWILATDLGFYT